MQFLKCKLHRTLEEAVVAFFKTANWYKPGGLHEWNESIAR
jgi:hypothetical protein